jgi:3-phenylpropionate/trans-cinnamate dioxygenase ferredoxin reductase component
VAAAERIVVVGGGLAAARVCQQLRVEGFTGELIVLGAETHLPYDRPPLSKDVLVGKRDESALRFDPVALSLDLRLGVEATGLDTARLVVQTRDGDVGFDRLVLATGATPIRLPGDGEQVTLRTLDDSLQLRERLQPGARVVIIGASWIGAEVATAALSRGSRVSCVEAGSAPCAQALGYDVARTLLPWWRDVDLLLDTPVRAVVPGGVALSNGDELPADVVVTGVGVRPTTGWLSDSGLELGRGVVVDEHLRTTNHSIVAVGDVAARWSPRWQSHLHVEHWDEAVTAPTAAARTLLHDDAATDALVPHDPIPYFWSDQFGHKVQYVGHHTPDDTVVWRDPDDGTGRAVAWLAPDGRLNAVLAVDRPKELVQARRAITAGATPDPQRLADPAISYLDA